MKPFSEEKFYDESGRLFNVIKCKSCVCCTHFYDCKPIQGMKLIIRKFEIRYINELFFKRKNI